MNECFFLFLADDAITICYCDGQEVHISTLYSSEINTTHAMTNSIDTTTQGENVTHGDSLYNENQTVLEITTPDSTLVVTSRLLDFSQPMDNNDTSTQGPTIETPLSVSAREVLINSSLTTDISSSTTSNITYTSQLRFTATALGTIEITSPSGTSPAPTAVPNQYMTQAENVDSTITARNTTPDNVSLSQDTSVTATRPKTTSDAMTLDTIQSYTSSPSTAKIVAQFELYDELTVLSGTISTISTDSYSHITDDITMPGSTDKMSSGSVMTYHVIIETDRNEASEIDTTILPTVTTDQFETDTTVLTTPHTAVLSVTPSEFHTTSFFESKTPLLSDTQTPFPSSFHTFLLSETDKTVSSEMRTDTPSEFQTTLLPGTYTAVLSEIHKITQSELHTTSPSVTDRTVLSKAHADFQTVLPPEINTAALPETHSATPSDFQTTNMFVQETIVPSKTSETVLNTMVLAIPPGIESMIAPEANIAILSDTESTALSMSEIETSSPTQVIIDSSETDSMIPATTEMTDMSYSETTVIYETGTAVHTSNAHSVLTTTSFANTTTLEKSQNSRRRKRSAEKNNSTLDANTTNDFTTGIDDTDPTSQLEYLYTTADSIKVSTSAHFSTDVIESVSGSVTGEFSSTERLSTVSSAESFGEVASKHMTVFPPSLTLHSNLVDSSKTITLNSIYPKVIITATEVTTDIESMIHASGTIHSVIAPHVLSSAASIEHSETHSIFEQLSTNRIDISNMTMHNSESTLTEINLNSTTMLSNQSPLQNNTTLNYSMSFTDSGEITASTSVLLEADNPTLSALSDATTQTMTTITTQNDQPSAPNTESSSCYCVTKYPSGTVHTTTLEAAEITTSGQGTITPRYDENGSSEITTYSPEADTNEMGNISHLTNTTKFTSVDTMTSTTSSNTFLNLTNENKTVENNETATVANTKMTSRSVFNVYSSTKSTTVSAVDTEGTHISSASANFPIMYNSITRGNMSHDLNNDYDFHSTSSDEIVQSIAMLDSEHFVFTISPTPTYQDYSTRPEDIQASVSVTPQFNAMNSLIESTMDMLSINNERTTVVYNEITSYNLLNSITDSTDSSQSTTVKASETEITNVPYHTVSSPLLHSSITNYVSRVSMSIGSNNDAELHSTASVESISSVTMSDLTYTTSTIAPTPVYQDYSTSLDVMSETPSILTIESLSEPTGDILSVTSLYRTLGNPDMDQPSSAISIKLKSTGGDLLLTDVVDSISSTKAEHSFSLAYSASSNINSISTSTSTSLQSAELIEFTLDTFTLSLYSNELTENTYSKNGHIISSFGNLGRLFHSESLKSNLDLHISTITSTNPVTINYQMASSSTNTSTG